jgi:hypothetical protein
MNEQTPGSDDGEYIADAARRVTPRLAAETVIGTGAPHMGIDRRVDPDHAPFTDNEHRLRAVSDEVARRKADALSHGATEEGATKYAHLPVSNEGSDHVTYAVDAPVNGGGTLMTDEELVVRGYSDPTMEQDEFDNSRAATLPASIPFHERLIGDVKDDVRYLRGAGAFENEDGKAELRLLARELLEMGHATASWDLYTEIAG